MVCLISILLLGCSGDSADEAVGDDTADTADTGSTLPPLGADVLVYEGDGGLPSDSGRYLIDGIDDLVAVYEGLGADVDITPELPDEMDPYRLMFWYLPGSSTDGQVSSQTIDELVSWIARGGRLVVAGDHGGSYGGYDINVGNETVGWVAESLGVSIRITEELSGEVTCNADGSHPLMEGDAKVSWYASSSLHVAPPAVWLYCSALAWQGVGPGEVVVIGDVNPVSDGPSRAARFVENLYTVPVTGEGG